MSIIQSHPFLQKLPKMSYSEHSDKIIKAIHHKIMPLYMNPKTKNFVQRQKLNKRPTFNQYSYYKEKTSNSLEKFDTLNKSFIIEKNQFSFHEQRKSIKRTSTNSISFVDLKRKKSQFTDSCKNLLKIKIERLPTIRNDIKNKKEELAKTLQNQSLIFQKDNFKESQNKIYNLEYVINRLGAYQQRKKKVAQQQIQPIRGYENLSPNKLKQYIECFKKKKNNPTQQVYISKKRIPLPRSSTEINQKQMKQQLKRLQSMVNLKSQKKVNSVKSKKDLSTTKKSFNLEAKSKKQIKNSLQNKQ